MNPKKPSRVNVFFILSACLTLAATLLTLVQNSRKDFGPRGRPIADITINLNGREVREHCTSCHPQGDRPDPSDLSIILARHPDIQPHQPEKLGCTGCHLGEGMALDLEISHGLPGLGGRKVLSGEGMQAGCYRCHELAPLTGANKAWEGYQLFMTKGCSSCHHVAGLSQGGYYGPDLSEIGSMLGLDQLQTAIREPQREPANSIMPRFPLSSSQARKIAYFLKSRVQNPFFTTPMNIQSGKITLPEVERAPADRDLTPGVQLLYRKQCLACHKYRKEDGRIAPDLTYIDRMRESSYLSRFLANPTEVIPDARMPRIAMTTDEQKILLDHLAQSATGPVSLEMGMAMPPHAAEGPADAATTGKNLYMQLCQRCHGAEGDGKGAIQPNLANFPRAFTGNAAYFQQRSKQQVLGSITKGIPGTSMPSYGDLLSRQEIEWVIDLISEAFIGSPAQTDVEPWLVPAAQDPWLSEEEQESLFRRKCSRCHGVSATGKGPEAQEHLPRPRNLHNRPYFASFNNREIVRFITTGVPGTAMPAFRQQLNDRQLWSLVALIRRFSATDHHEEADK